MKPRWMRNHVSCPTCGKIVYESDEGWKHIRGGTASYDCTKCGAHHSWEDFWEHNHEKWDRTADLSGEEISPADEQQE